MSGMHSWTPRPESASSRWWKALLRVSQVNSAPCQHNRAASGSELKQGATGSFSEWMEDFKGGFCSSTHWACLLRHLPRYKSILEQFSQNSPTVLTLPSQRHQGLPSLPCQCQPLHPPASSPATLSPFIPNTPALASSLVLLLPLPFQAVLFSLQPCSFLCSLLLCVWSALNILPHYRGQRQTAKSEFLNHPGFTSLMPVFAIQFYVTQSLALRLYWLAMFTCVSLLFSLLTEWRESTGGESVSLHSSPPLP